MVRGDVLITDTSTGWDFGVALEGRMGCVLGKSKVDAIRDGSRAAIGTRGSRDPVARRELELVLELETGRDCCVRVKDTRVALGGGLVYR